MGLRLVARYYDRSEAVVASAALDAAGMPNWIESFNQIAVQPFWEIALHGYRLMVVEEELAAALSVIEEARRTRSFEGERLSKHHLTLVTFVLFFATGFWFADTLFLPLQRHKWHDVSETPP